eukprot:CAMPEP_0185195078 /NCGR_PEP_ID=MMETSP1140-20130426/33455_1 /TAXON_ID=298111 /ORGANISM="Pavlova sp., Strain CCMP459" /LENGTH=50 /DNA_ID=CAMNT_0027762041 /DNA_START=42 /DNA_END=194 /DNA_ORIENTATION=-
MNTPGTALHGLNPSWRRGCDSAGRYHGVPVCINTTSPESSHDLMGVNVPK